jgi:hypothetical protein
MWVNPPLSLTRDSFPCILELGGFSVRMEKKETPKKLPAGGFTKVTRESAEPLSQEKRAALIRKGNELFNRGELGLAGRIFSTTGYSDGLIRLGDRCFKDGKPLDALRWYRQAPCPEKADALSARVARVVSEWLKEE